MIEGKEDGFGTNTDRTRNLAMSGHSAAAVRLILPHYEMSFT